MHATRERDAAARAYLADVMEKRRGELGLMWNQVAELAGLTKEGLRGVRTSTRKIQAPSKRGIERALRWGPGSIDRILDGQDPVELPPAPEGLETTDEFPAIAVGAGGADSPEEAVRLPKWLFTQVQRRQRSPGDVAKVIDMLRDVAEDNGYRLGELLTEAGLAEPDELVEEPADPFEEYRIAVENIKASPHLSASQRKAIDAQYREVLKAYGKDAGDA